MKAFNSLDIDYTLAPQCDLSLADKQMHAIVTEVLSHENQNSASTSLHIQTCTPVSIQEINAHTRHKDKPTNVLAFSYPQQLHDESRFLGDIILCPEIIAEEALQQNKSIEQHTTHMLVHALLHLLGYDHEDDDQAQLMEQHEIAILAKLNFPNPYEEQ